MSLLVVGTEGAEGLDEYFVGSNAEKIVRKASCPVITIQDKCESGANREDRICFLIFNIPTMTSWLN